MPYIQSLDISNSSKYRLILDSPKFSVASTPTALIAKLELQSHRCFLGVNTLAGIVGLTPSSHYLSIWLTTALNWARYRKLSDKFSSKEIQIIKSSSFIASEYSIKNKKWKLEIFLCFCWLVILYLNFSLRLLIEISMLWLCTSVI